MAEANAEAKRLLGVTIIALLVGVINGLVLVLLLLNPPTAGGPLRVGLAGVGAALGFAVAARFARQRQRQLEARLNGDRS
jgi:hypothetical protein